MTLLGYFSYKNILIIDEYDISVNRKSETIQKQVKEQQRIAKLIREKMDFLFSLVNSQTNMISEFNTQIQNQTSTFEEISATLEELLSSAENISRTAQDELNQNLTMEGAINNYRDIKNETRTKLDQAISEMSQLVSEIDLSKEKLKLVENSLRAMKEDSVQIKETTEVIIDIADKINMLSLNASIEAARAGDFGRGFADEIGKLAQQTTDSIKNINSVMEHNSRNTLDGVTKIQDATNIILDLIKSIVENSKTIGVLKEYIITEDGFISEITQQMIKNIELAKNTDSATSEQKIAIESTTKAMELMNEVLANMVDGINQISVTSQKISESAEELLRQTKSSDIG